MSAAALHPGVEQSACGRTSASLSVIVISFNTRDLTLTALRTLHENADYPFEVVVVDNASDDGSADAIEREFPGARLVRSPHNLGFALANNEGAKYASGEVLLLLNPDTEVLPGAVRKLMALREEHPNAGLWGGRTLYADGSPNPSSCWRRQTLWSLVLQATGLPSVWRTSQLLNPERVYDLRPAAATPVDIVSGCFLLIDREFFDRLKGFDPRFFMYGDDADLSLRAQQAGAKPLVSHEATIIHHGGASERVPAEKLIRLIKAKATLIHVHFPPHKRRLGIWLLAAWPLSRLLAHRLFGVFLGGRYQERADAWALVWRRRDEWLPGFDKDGR